MGGETGSIHDGPKLSLLRGCRACHGKTGRKMSSIFSTLFGSCFRSRKTIRDPIGEFLYNVPTSPRDKTVAPRSLVLVGS